MKTSTQTTPSTSPIDHFTSKKFSSVENAKDYGQIFLKLLRHEHREQFSKSALDKILPAKLLRKVKGDEILDKEIFLLQLEKELSRMEAAKSGLQIQIGTQRFRIKYEEEKSKKRLPELSEQEKIREEKLLLVSEIPEEALLEIGVENRAFTLVVSDPDQYIVIRTVKAVKEAIRYVMDKLTGKIRESKQKNLFGQGFKPPNYNLKWDYDTTDIEFEGQHLYSALLSDHGMLVTQEESFALQLPEAKMTGKRSNLKITLKDPKTLKREFELDPNQLEAIQTTLNSPISLIKGPPGTGKTHTATILAMILLNQLLKSEDVRNKKLLICAQSNTGVNNLVEKLVEYGANVTKITGRTQMANESALKAYDLCTKLKRAIQSEESLRDLPCAEIMAKLKSLQTKRLDLSSAEDKLLDSYGKILDETQVICCTLNMLPSYQLKGLEFPLIIMDEASQANEPEALHAFNKHPQKLIMFGDDKQLCPTVTSREAKRLGLSYSLFSRLVSNKLPDVEVHMLTTQYRMPARLAELPSYKFYESKLKSYKATPSKDFDWMCQKFGSPDKRTPIALFNVESSEQVQGTAYKNAEEAKELVKTIKEMCQGSKKVRPEQIGVIAYYTPQVDLIKDGLFAQGIKGVEVNSVDGFQGRDKEIIIISMVRSNDRGEIGFVCNHQRFNVAVTRAKEWILIFCNRDTILRKGSIWTAYFRYYRL